MGAPSMTPRRGSPGGLVASVPGVPRVSVIIPAFNAQDSIAATIESVLAQTFGDWELIVGDDASTDQTAAVARASDPRVSVVTALENGGPAAARNLAIREARGELLAFVDADDTWVPEYLSTQIAQFDRASAAGRRVGIVACDAEVVDGSGAGRGSYLDRLGDVSQITLERLLAGNPIFVSTVVPRAVVAEAGGFTPAAWGSADHDLWIKIVERGYEVVMTRERLVRYLESESNMSANLAGMAGNSEIVYQRALERGNLSTAQRRIARRMLRLQRAIATLELALSSGRPNAGEVPGLLSAAAVLGAFAARQPRRWPGWARALVAGNGTPWRPRRAG